MVAAASRFPDGRLVFDTAEPSGPLDHVAPSSAALLGAETPSLPILGGAFSDELAARLKQEFGIPLITDQDMQIEKPEETRRPRPVSHRPAGCNYCSGVTFRAPRTSSTKRPFRKNSCLKDALDDEAAGFARQQALVFADWLADPVVAPL